MLGQFFNRCPQMDAVRTSDPAVRMAQRLWTNIVLLLNGRRFGGNLVFPKTPITRTGLLRAVVSPCHAQGTIEDENGTACGDIWIDLAEERVIGPEALPVEGRGEFTIPGFIVAGRIDAKYGAVFSLPEGDGDWLVGSVNAKGKLTF